MLVTHSKSIQSGIAPTGGQQHLRVEQVSPAGLGR